MESLWSSTIASILFLSIAGGALIYVSLLMYNSGRLQTTNTVLMVGIFFGIIAGFITRPYNIKLEEPDYNSKCK